MAATPDGRGYWLVAQDGGIFTFGDATFYGSMGGVRLNAPITGMAATATGHGYWMVAADGGIFTFGDATFYGSMGGAVLNDPVVDMVAAPHDTGYLMVATDGEVFPFGSAGFYGSLAGGYGGDPADVPPIAGIALTPDGQGYWLLEPDGWSYGFTNPPSPAPTATTSAIVSIANSQVNSDPDKGSFCNPYGPCEEWCALFATWVWEQAGVPIPSYPFTGSIYNWAAAHTAVLPPDRGPASRGRRPVRDRAVVHGHLGPRGAGGPGLAGRGRGHRRGRCRAGADRVAGRGRQRPLPAVAVGVVQRRAHLRLRPAVVAGPARAARFPPGLSSRRRGGPAPGPGGRRPNPTPRPGPRPA